MSADKTKPSKYDQYKNYPTEPGFYCIGWERDDPDKQEEYGPDFGEILYFDGSEWFDSDQIAQESLWCPLTQSRVDIKSADYYVRQKV